MTKKFYVLVESDTAKIRDIIEYRHEGYAEQELEIPLPVNVLGGAYKLMGGACVYVPEWDKDTRIDELEAQAADMDEFMTDMLYQQALTDLGITEEGGEI